MPVTVTKKMTLKQAKNAEQNEKDLSVYRSFCKFIKA
jgi:hypothetical protein